MAKYFSVPNLHVELASKLSAATTQKLQDKEV